MPTRSMNPLSEREIAAHQNAMQLELAVSKVVGDLFTPEERLFRQDCEAIWACIIKQERFRIGPLKRMARRMGGVINLHYVFMVVSSDSPHPYRAEIRNRKDSEYPDSGKHKTATEKRRRAFGVDQQAIDFGNHVLKLEASGQRRAAAQEQAARELKLRRGAGSRSLQNLFRRYVQIANRKGFVPASAAELMIPIPARMLRHSLADLEPVRGRTSKK